jgi:hypothetical protein
MVLYKVVISLLYILPHILSGQQQFPSKRKKLHLELKKLNTYLQNTYLNESEGVYPFIPLVVLHMRKSGGSSMLGMLDYWYNVTTPDTFSKVHHCEYRCLNANQILKNIPHRSSRIVDFVYLTSLRDPIARIGSQAFFAVTQTGLGLGTIKRFVKKARCDPLHCPSPRADPSQCECHLQATQAALEHIRTSEALWHRWMNRPTVFDGYIDNYFITRLTGAVPHANQTLGAIQDGHFREAVRCLRDPTYSGCRDVRGILVNYTNAQNETSLERPGKGGSLSKAYKCNTTRSSFPPRDSEEDIQSSLTLSKALLRRVFDFVVIDKMEETCGRGALLHALHAPRAIVSDMLRLHERPGFINRHAHILNISGRYEDLMPARVLAELRERNAADMELYDFAQRLLVERARAEEWDCEDT